LFISQIECSNYRSYGNKSIFNLKPGLNPIVGENNSGKSNLLRAIDIMINRLSQHTPINRDEYEVDENNNIIRKIPPLEKEIANEEYHKHDDNRQMKFNLRFNLDENESQKFSIPLPNKPNFTITGFELSFEIVYHKEEAYKKRPTKINNAFIKYFPKDNSVNIQETNILNKIYSDFKFEEFMTFFKENIYNFPEFRYKPSRNQSNSIRSTSGSELASVLYKMKNSLNNDEQERYEKIVTEFKNLVGLGIKVSENHILEFMDNGIPISIDGVGGGIIELLIFLTHIVDQNNKIFFIDEPELHLHPHSKRLLMTKFKDAGKSNQIIFTTHSQDLLLFRDIEKITLIRKIIGESRIFQYNANIDDYMKRTLKRIIKSEQKEFLFAKFVILVEGDTEFGALPIFAKNLGYDFDQYSISVIPVEGNYFVGLMRILQQYGIPFIALYDEDVLFKITNHIEINGVKIKTSTLINQLYELDLLDKNDVELIRKWEKYTDQDINIKSYSYRLSSIIKSLKPHLSNPNIKNIYENNKRYEKDTFSEKYKQSLKNDIYDFINKKGIEKKYTFRFLSPNFEKFFQEKGFKEILDKAKFEYGNNKVLCGKYLAEKIKKEKIPEEISEIITISKNNIIKNTSSI